MKRLFNIFLILCIWQNAFSQDTIIKPNYSIGITNTNFQDYGMCFGFNIKRHSFVIHNQFINSIYISSDEVTPGPTSGYGIGFNYEFQISKLNNKKWYIPKIMVGYLYRNIVGFNYSRNYGFSQVNYDKYENIHDISLGFINCFIYKDFEFRFIPKIGKLYNKGMYRNYIEINDIYNPNELPTEPKDINWKYWENDPTLSLELGIIYKFGN